VLFADRGGHRGPFGVSDVEVSAEGRERGEDVAEDDDSVGAKSGEGLEGDGDNEFWRLGALTKDRVRIRQAPILRHIPARLPHHPCRWPLRDLPAHRSHQKRRLVAAAAPRARRSRAPAAGGAASADQRHLLFPRRA
jgi:hypothetical protein